MNQVLQFALRQAQPVVIRYPKDLVPADELIGATELRLSPKESSGGPEGTIFYCKTDNSIWVATE